MMRNLISRLAALVAVAFIAIGFLAVPSAGVLAAMDHAVHVEVGADAHPLDAVAVFGGAPDAAIGLIAGLVHDDIISATAGRSLADFKALVDCGAETAIVAAIPRSQEVAPVRGSLEPGLFVAAMTDASFTSVESTDSFRNRSPVMLN